MPTKTEESQFPCPAPEIGPRAELPLDAGRGWKSSSRSGRIIRNGIGFARYRALQRAGQRHQAGSIAVSFSQRKRTVRMRRKVLVVDDDPYLTTQLRKLLQTDELSVDTVSNAQEALTALGTTDYSVLITDLRMPGMGGIELIREVSQRRVLVTTIVTT